MKLPRSLFGRRIAFALLTLVVGVVGVSACSIFTDLSTLSTNPDEDARDERDDATAPPEAGAEDRSSPPPGETDGGDGGDDPCASNRGPTMVRVTTPSGSFCIDSTEVTQSQYLQFLQARAGDTSGQGPRCGWNTTFAPSLSCSTIPSFDPVTRGNLPVSGVDWCDATAYCAWAGKRLCGGLEGTLGASDSVPLTDATKDAWFAACSNNGTQPYPYGFSFVGAACNGRDRDAGDLLPAGSLATCQGGVPGLFDMSGSLLEWEAACDDAASGNGADDPCVYRGGTYYSDRDSMMCARINSVRRAHVDGDCDLGIRCCR